MKERKRCGTGRITGSTTHDPISRHKCSIIRLQWTSTTFGYHANRYLWRTTTGTSHCRPGCRPHCRPDGRGIGCTRGSDVDRELAGFGIDGGKHGRRFANRLISWDTPGQHPRSKGTIASGKFTSTEKKFPPLCPPGPTKENPTPRLLDLYSGTGSIGRLFADRGYEVTRVDWDARYEPEIVTDMFRWDYWYYPPGHYDVITASPLYKI